MTEIGFEASLEEEAGDDKGCFLYNHLTSWTLEVNSCECWPSGGQHLYPSVLHGFASTPAGWLRRLLISVCGPTRHAYLHVLVDVNDNDSEFDSSDVVMRVQTEHKT